LFSRELLPSPKCLPRDDRSSTKRKKLRGRMDIGLGREMTGFYFNFGHIFF